MSRHHVPSVSARVLASTLLLALMSPAAGFAVGVSVMSDDGAWSWFSDPRAICQNGTVYTGWVTTGGDIQLGSYDLLQGRSTRAYLEESFGQDDHDYPAIFQTSDGRYTAFYAGHAVFRTHNLYRTSTYPFDITSWGERDSTGVNTVGAAGVTYSNPYAIPGETDRIYLIWRGGDWKPAYAIGTYDPVTTEWTWSFKGRLIYTPVGRPYFKCAVGQDKIGIAFTDGHPKEIPCNIYYVAIGKDADGQEAFFSADGSLIKRLSVGPLVKSEADTVFNRLACPELTGDNSWVWDLAFDSTGAPVVAFATFPSRSHHQYHWARFDGYGWDDEIVVSNAGGSVADTTIGTPQYYYSGGIALDPLDPDVVYVSVGNAFGGSDLMRARKEPDGFWSLHDIAGGTVEDNMRPIVPRGGPPDTEMVLWMKGRYDYYKNTLVAGECEYREGVPRELPVPNGEFATEPLVAGTLNYDTAIMLWVNPATASIPDEVATRGPRLCQSRPNPFRTTTEIAYELPVSERAILCVHDAAGRLVRTVVDEQVPAGRHRVEWDGRDESGHAAASGVYFVRLTTGGVVDTRRCVLIR